MKRSTKTYTLYMSFVETSQRRLDMLSAYLDERTTIDHLLMLLWMTHAAGKKKTSERMVYAYKAYAEFEGPEFSRTPWITEDVMKEIMKVFEKNTFKQVVELGGEIYSKKIGMDVKSFDYLKTILFDRTSGKQSLKSSRKTNEVTLEMIERIERKTPGTRYDWSLKCLWGFSSYEAVVLVLRPIYLTGMRPVELLTTRLLLPAVTSYGEEEIQQKINQSTRAAIEEGYYFDIEDAAGLDRHEATEILRNYHKKNGAKTPALFVIYTRKQGNIPEENRQEYRALRLDGITFENLEALYYASYLKHSIRNETDQKKPWDFKKGENPTHERRMTYLRNRLGKLLPRACIQGGMTEQSFDLGTLRHSFATRTRSLLSPEEATALHGNSSQRTTRAYGKKGVRKGALGLQSGKISEAERQVWLPGPDPEQVKKIKLRLDLEALTANKPAKDNPKHS